LLSPWGADAKEEKVGLGLKTEENRGFRLGHGMPQSWRQRAAVVAPGYGLDDPPEDRFLFRGQ
jgi:hypothetical protein